jgi:hypothetical protein
MWNVTATGWLEPRFPAPTRSLCLGDLGQSDGPKVPLRVQGRAHLCPAPGSPSQPRCLPGPCHPSPSYEATSQSVVPDPQNAKAPLCGGAPVWPLWTRVPPVTTHAQRLWHWSVLQHCPVVRTRWPHVQNSVSALTPSRLSSPPHTRRRAHMCIYVYTRSHVHTHACRHVYTCICTRKHSCWYTHMCTHMYSSPAPCTRMHAHTHAHTALACRGSNHTLSLRRTHTW